MKEPTAPSRAHLPLDGCVVDLPAQVVRWPDGPRSLTGTEARLLRYFADNAGRVIGPRELLDRVWGYRAGVESRTVKTTIARLRLKIEQVPASPHHVVTVVGGGYRFDPSPRRAAATPSEPPAPEAPPPRAPIPASPALVGRARERDLLRAELAARNAIVTICGAAGVGKTALALSVLAEAGPEEFGEIRFVSFGDVEGSEGAVRAVSAAVGARVPSDTGSTAAVAAACSAHHRLVLCLDGVDRHLAWVADLCLDLDTTRRAPVILCTSREPLGIRGERVVPLGPLAPPDATALFLLRAGPTALAGFTEPARLAAVLRSLDGLPLAIELCAGWAPLLDPEQLAARLEADPALLGSGRGSLRAALDSAWVSLDEAQRDALAQLAVFTTPVPLDAIEAVVVPRGGESSLGLVRRLHHRSLLAIHNSDDAGAPRFGLLATVRSFVRSREPAEAARARHARHFASMGDDRCLHALRRRGADRSLRMLEAARPELEAALQWALGAGDGPLAAHLLRALLAWSAARGPILSYEAAARAACAASLPPVLHAALLGDRALAYGLAGRMDEAEDLSAQAERSCCSAKDRPSRARALLVRARLAANVHDPRAAERALLALDAAGSVPGLRASAESLLGVALAAAGRGVEAASRLTEALRLARGVEDRRTEAECLEHLGRYELSRGRGVRALSFYSAGLAAAVDLGDQALEADLLESVATVEVRHERVERAIPLLERALRLRRNLGHRVAEGRAEVALAECHFLRGQRPEARAAVERGLVIALALADRHTEARARAVLGRMELELGRIRDARLALERVQELGLSLGASAWVATARTGLAEIHFHAGELELARSLMADAATALEGLGDRALACGTLRRWADWEWDVGQPQRAADLRAEAERMGELSHADTPATLAGSDGPLRWDPTALP